MPRRARTLAAGEYYHLYNRGNNRQAIFFERENYLYFLKQFRHFVAAETADVVAYCLMPNHYHVLVYVREDGLSKAMQRLRCRTPTQLIGAIGGVGRCFRGGSIPSMSIAKPICCN